MSQQLFANFTDCYVGPFDTMEALNGHVQWCQEHGAGDEFIGVADTVPAGADTVTPAEDRESVEQTEVRPGDTDHSRPKQWTQDQLNSESNCWGEVPD